ncbi:ELM1/GtrOC1 family putative glycosyltransferase [Tateyamaria pelophila]|uniref:ELM1/GtrOC1 family putative glycosyltransferase n=1 Tax=Tateyamaria pelophila TaxID=328415 RepID=UPI001CC0B375|nr:ELM1/GtrOC1 family putative glycosyltransferase [Tateyamaria pelophila]
MTESLTRLAHATTAQTDTIPVAGGGSDLIAHDGEAIRSFVLSTAKNGHVTQCIAVADLIGLEIEDVIQEPGVNKALPDWRRELEKTRWLLPALRIAWRFRKGKFIILASGRSVLPACRLIKKLRGDNVFILFIGSPKKWTTRCTDVMLRSKHEREEDRDEENRYPWNPKQIWVDAPICRPLPVSASKENGVAVLLGGLNITYGDEVADYEAFLDHLDALVQSFSISIVFSRRTKPEVEQAFHKRFANTSAKLVDAADRQGFLDACAGAGAFVVTPDSITMVAEACATGKPVYTVKLPVKREGTRNHRFIETTLKKGYAQPFEGEINFERRTVDRDDIEAARRVMIDCIDAWKRDPSTLSS